MIRGSKLKRLHPKALCYSTIVAVLLFGLAAGGAKAKANPRPTPARYAFSLNDLFRSNEKPRPRQKLTCPPEVQALTRELLVDLPAYINRSNRWLVGRKPIASETYAIVASQPDFQPIALTTGEAFNPPDPNLHQVFFTVLERQYSGQQLFEWQNYYWLFLAKTEQGWQLALLFSRFGAYPGAEQPLTQLRDSSQGITAQAIRTWLRDCQAGTVWR